MKQVMAIAAVCAALFGGAAVGVSQMSAEPATAARGDRAVVGELRKIRKRLGGMNETLESMRELFGGRVGVGGPTISEQLGAICRGVSTDISDRALAC